MCWSPGHNGTPALGVGQLLVGVAAQRGDGADDLQRVDLQGEVGRVGPQRGDEVADHPLREARLPQPGPPGARGAGGRGRQRGSNASTSCGTLCCTVLLPGITKKMIKKKWRIWCRATLLMSANCGPGGR